MRKKSIKINYAACVQNLDGYMILLEVYIVFVKEIYQMKLKVKSMSILKIKKNRLPFAELYSPMNRFVRYRTVMAARGEREDY